jgi:excisionase family DNA binding protein
MVSPTEFVSVSETARILGACPQTVRRLIARGKLRALSFGYQYRVELNSIGAMRVGAGVERTNVHD